MKERYDSIKKVYKKVNMRNAEKFIKKCKLFLTTTNKLIQRESKKSLRKIYRGMFHEIAVLMIKVERRFKNKTRKSLTLVNCESAFDDKISTSIIVNHEHKSLETFLSDAQVKVIEFLKSKLHNLALKVCLMLSVILEVKEEFQPMYFYTTTCEIFRSEKLKRWYKKQVLDVLLNRFSTLELGPSNTSLSEIISLSIYTFSFQPAQISRVGTYIPTPKELVGRKSILNIKNLDNFCFLHCINAYVNPTEINSYRVSNYPPLEALELNLHKITFPIRLADIEKFEKKTVSHLMFLDYHPPIQLRFFIERKITKRAITSIFL